MAGADAKAFAATMAARLGPLHERTVPRVLVNGAGAADAPTAANILDALGRLRQSRANDTLALFVSGHGLNEGLNYRFLATDAAFDGDALRSSTVVPWVNFQETVEAANGRRILFLDTCHSGNSYNQRLSNDSYAANIIVYSAARWDQEALERRDLGHGLFTYAVVEGVNGAAKTATGEVRTESLRDFLSKRVPELAQQLKREQVPQYFRGRDAQDYVLAVGNDCSHRGRPDSELCRELLLAARHLAPIGRSRFPVFGTGRPRFLPDPDAMGLPEGLPPRHNPGLFLVNRVE